jgi:hypothetical protein
MMMFYVLRVIGYPLREEKGNPMSQQANEATERSRPHAFSILLFGDLFNNATTVIAALGSLFTLIGTIVGAYFGIKVSNDTSERSRGAIEKAHGSAMEANEKTQKANERAQKANDTAKKALAELNPDVARRIVDR